MNAVATDRLEFAPPPQPAAVRAFILAVLAHLLLMAALTWGINWKKEAENVSAEAELWAALPQQVAPPEVVQPRPPVVKPPPVVEPPVQPDAQIAVEREKRKQELAEQRRLEQEAQKKLEAKKKLEARRKQEEEERRQEIAEQKAAEKAAEKAAAEKRQKEELAKDKAKQQANEKKMAAMRAEQIARSLRMAGTPAPSGGGGSQPSAAYAAKIAARIRPHIRHSIDVPGNPPVEIEIRLSPDGTIVGQRVVKTSGNSAWDESAIRAVIATASLPRNEEGRVITPMVVILKQRN